VRKGAGVAEDVAVIRPQMRIEDVRARGRELSQRERAAVRRRLRTLHMLEIMAVNIYKCQVGGTDGDLETALAAAMCNEMTHMQDFQTKLYEFGFTPSKLRGRFWLVGYAFGLGSRFLGRKARLRMGIWSENKAVEHYGRLLGEVDWEEETRTIIEKDLADERGHVARWRRFLDEGGANGPL
jgi:demethoxyubiquinone hydroxylase (CLK1/Coq7/Cat5 family)